MSFLKVFLDFFKKKTPKMSMTNEQINMRLAEIYRLLNRIQDLADVVMYDPFINTEIKELSLNWFESKLDSLKDELCEISELVCGN